MGSSISKTSPEKTDIQEEPEDFQQLWTRLKEEGAFRSEPVNFLCAGPDLPPCPEGYVRFVCVSDTHSLHESISQIVSSTLTIPNPSN